MVYRLEALYEHELGKGNVAEGDRTLLEVAVSHIAVDNLVTRSAMLSSVYSGSERDAASTPSAIIRIACSRVNGLGPGYLNGAVSTSSSGCSFLYLM